MTVVARPEASRLASLVENLPPSVAVVYGPRGSGLTTLLHQAAAKLNETLVVYIDAAAETPPYLYIKPKTRIPLQTPCPEPDGRCLALAAPILLAKLAYNPVARRTGRIVLIIDHAYTIGLEKLKDHVEALKASMEKLLRNNIEAKTLIALPPSAYYAVAEQLNVDKTFYTWNMDRRTYTLLAEALGIPPETYTFTGGNPEAAKTIATIYKGNVNRWLKSLKHKVSKVARKLRNLAKTLKCLGEADTETKRILAAYDLAIQLRGEAIAEEEPKHCKNWAWQLPAYSHILAENRT